MQELHAQQNKVLLEGLSRECVRLIDFIVLMILVAGLVSWVYVNIFRYKPSEGKKVYQTLSSWKRLQGYLFVM